MNTSTRIPTLTITLLILGIGISATVLLLRPSQEKGTKYEYQEDFKQCVEIFEEHHKNVYTYISKEEYERFAESQFNKISDTTTLAEFFLILSETVAFVKCYHSFALPPKSLTQSAGEFPISTFYHRERIFVLEDLSESASIPRGAEILEINGQPISEAIAQIVKTISTDGGIKAAIDSRIDAFFPFYITWNLKFPNLYTLKYRSPLKSTPTFVSIYSVPLAQIKTKLSRGPMRKGKNLDFVLYPEIDTAKLVVRSFVFYGDKLPEFRNFIEDSFSQIKESGIQKLIIDVRENGGGDPYAASILLSHLAKEPIRYFGNVPGHEDLKKAKPPAKNAFTGDVYLLVDGFCSSTCGHFVSLVKYHNLAKLVGTGTGATYFCSGSPKRFTLRHTGINLSVGQSAYETDVSGMEKGKSIDPDFPFKQTFGDILNGRDALLEYALQLTND